MHHHQRGSLWAIAYGQLLSQPDPYHKQLMKRAIIIRLTSIS